MRGMRHGDEVVSRDGAEVGRVTGNARTWCAACGRPCRIGVRWPGGKVTRPCERMTRADGARWVLA
jgi:hypothetical protein